MSYRGENGGGEWWPYLMLPVVFLILWYVVFPLVAGR